MIPASKNRRRNRRHNRPRASSSESRASVAMTVAWTVSVTTLVVCELMALGMIAFLGFAPDAEGLRPIVGLIQFCSFVLAGVSMAVLPVVYRVRRVPPPRAVVAFAAIAAGVPILVAIWQMLA